MKIYINVSETIANRLRTGIQRVVREVISNAEVVSKKIDITVIPVVAYGSNFHQLNDKCVLFEKRSLSKKDVYIIYLAKRLFKSIAFTRYIAVRSLKFVKSKFHIVNSYCEQEPICINDGDVLLLLDSFWSNLTTVKATRKFRQDGGKVIAVIYDVIPITHPQYCDSVNAASFQSILSEILGLSHGFISISNAALNEIRFVIHTQYHQYAGLPSEYFYLGANLNSKVSDEDSIVKAWPHSLWDENAVFLMVGTIEPRKGHEFILDAFEQRWKEGSSDKLLIVGKVGWKTEQLIKRIAHSEYFGTQLLMINDVTDCQLEEAYKKSYACIMASHAEGFGLPVIEALQRGIPVISSNIPVFVEVAGDYANFFALGDIRSFNDALNKVKENYKNIKLKLQSFKWMSWEDSTEQLLIKVLKTVKESDNNFK